MYIPAAAGGFRARAALPYCVPGDTVYNQFVTRSLVAGRAAPVAIGLTHPPAE
jgi:hypothetical protein